jgi:hypothetical protein
MIFIFTLIFHVFYLYFVTSSFVWLFLWQPKKISSFQVPKCCIYFNLCISLNLQNLVHVKVIQVGKGTCCVNICKPWPSLACNKMKCPLSLVKFWICFSTFQKLFPLTSLIVHCIQFQCAFLCIFGSPSFHTNQD